MDGPVSAAYMVIENSSGQADRLINASSSAAEVTEIHETKQMDDGMMGMQPLVDGLEIPANGSVTLKPGGYHIMMMKLRQHLSPGQTFTLTLKFQSGKEISLDVPVKEP
jgi:copper(I)-binding protein